MMIVVVVLFQMDGYQLKCNLHGTNDDDDDHSDDDNDSESGGDDAGWLGCTSTPAQIQHGW